MCHDLEKTLEKQKGWSCNVQSCTLKNMFRGNKNRFKGILSDYKH